MIPRVSSSSSRIAQRRGLKISRRRHPPVTNVHSLYLRSWTNRNLAGPGPLLTRIAILLCLSCGRSFRLGDGSITLYYWAVKIIGQVTRARIVTNQKHETQEEDPRPELHYYVLGRKIFSRSVKDRAHALLEAEDVVVDCVNVSGSYVPCETRTAPGYRLLESQSLEAVC